MSESKIAAHEPAVLELEAGTYYWCACGRSANQPFCDGAHAETDIVPQAFDLAEKACVALCRCKHSKTPPFCDGSHAEL
jgi:CDGSH-type Zn-finger protein